MSDREGGLNPSTKEGTGYEGIKAFINGEQPEFDVPPIIEEGRTLVPLRAISESLKATVVWKAEERSITLTRDGKEIKLIIGSTTVLINGQEVQLDVPAQIIGSRTIVPVRFISEVFGAIVLWEAQTKSVVIVDEAAQPTSGTDTTATTTDTMGTAAQTTTGTTTTEATFGTTTN
jgi:hypothetical protein